MFAPVNDLVKCPQDDVMLKSINQVYRPSAYLDRDYVMKNHPDAYEGLRHTSVPVTRASDTIASYFAAYSFFCENRKLVMVNKLLSQVSFVWNDLGYWEAEGEMGLTVMKMSGTLS